MAENETPGVVRQFLIRTIYLKDVSFETPNSPEIFRKDWKPESQLQFDIKVKPLGEDTYEVVLALTVTSKLEEQTAYLIEVHQAGIVTIQGLEEAELEPLFYVYCPGLLYPYAREAANNLVAKGGFPQLVLQHVNFDQIYAQKLAERDKQQVATPPPPPETTH